MNFGEKESTKHTNTTSEEEHEISGDEELIKIFKFLKQRGYCINSTIPENCKCIVSEIGVIGDVNSGVVGCINCAEQLTCSYCRSKTAALYKEDYCFRCSWRNIDSEGKSYRKDPYYW